MSTRNIRLFSLNGHVGPEILDYARFFSWLYEIPTPLSRVSVWDDLVFVIESAEEGSDYLALHFISGDPSEQPLTYNEATGALDRGSASEESWPARQTRVVVNAKSRLLALESRHAGVSAKNLERYFGLIARERGFAPDLSLDLGAIQSESFEKELNKFVRIRQASITLHEPNIDWDDTRDAVGALASSSNGAKVETTVSAGRNESLSRDAGIVSVIRQHARHALTAITRAAVVGHMQGEEGEVTLSTDKHQRRATVKLPRKASEFVIASSVVEGAVALIADAAVTQPQEDAASGA